MNRLKSELQYSNLFWEGKATNRDELADFANFDPKIGWQHPLSDWEKRVKSVMYNQIPTIW